HRLGPHPARVPAVRLRAAALAQRARHRAVPAAPGGGLPPPLRLHPRHPRHRRRVVARGALDLRLRAAGRRRQRGGRPHRGCLRREGDDRGPRHRRWPQRPRRVGAGARHRADPHRRRRRELRLRRDHRGTARAGHPVGHLRRGPAVRGAQGRWLPHAVHHPDPDRHHPRRPVGHRAPRRGPAPRPGDLPPAGTGPIAREVHRARRQGGLGMSQSTLTRPDARDSVVLPPVKWRGPGFMAVFTLVSLLGFTLFTEPGTTTFRTATGGELAEIPNTEVPTVPALWVLTLVMAAVTAYAGYRATRRQPLGWWPPALFGAAFVLAFLTWQGSGGTIPVTSLLT